MASVMDEPIASVMDGSMDTRHEPMVSFMDGSMDNHHGIFHGRALLALLMDETVGSTTEQSTNNAIGRSMASFMDEPMV